MLKVPRFDFLFFVLFVFFRLLLSYFAFALCHRPNDSNMSDNLRNNTSVSFAVELDVCQHNADRSEWVSSCQGRRNGDLLLLQTVLSKTESYRQPSANA